MNVEFQSDSNLKKDQIKIKVISLEETAEVKNLLAYIQDFGKKVDSILPVKTEDRILTIKIEEIIKVEVEKTELTFYTKSAVIKTTGRLGKKPKASWYNEYVDLHSNDDATSAKNIKAVLPYLNSVNRARRSEGGSVIKGVTTFDSSLNVKC